MKKENNFLDLMGEIDEKFVYEASLPWKLMAELRERQGNMEEALQDMEKALSLTSISKAWTKLQQLSGNKESFQNIVNLRQLVQAGCTKEAANR